MKDVIYADRDDVTNCTVEALVTTFPFFLDHSWLHASSKWLPKQIQIVLNTFHSSHRNHSG